MNVKNSMFWYDAMKEKMKYTTKNQVWDFFEMSIRHIAIDGNGFTRPREVPLTK